MRDVRIGIEDIARAAIAGDALETRSLAQDWLASQVDLSTVARPDTRDQTLLAVSAALLELFATRSGIRPPSWTATIGALPDPLFLVKSCATMPRLRQMCEQESPLPLRSRRIYAPPNYLTAA